MTDHERELLSRFLQQLMQARVETKDPEADTMIRNAVSRHPDAPYLLVQRALLLDQAMEAANARIAQLQQQLDRAGGGQRAAGGSFLGDNAWGRSASADAAMPAAGMPGAGVAAPAGRGGLLSRLRGQPQQAAGYGAPAYQPGYAPGGGRMGSFLGTAAATAAGVAGGAFLFHGLSNLLGDDNNPAAASAQDASASSLADAGQSDPMQMENQFGETAALTDQPADTGAGWSDEPLADAGGLDQSGGDSGGDFGGGDFGGDYSDV